MRRRPLLVLLATIFALVLMVWYVQKPSRSITGREDHPGQEVSFDRRLEPVIYTKHALCRMGCRHIDKDEVKDILYNGTINYSKSDPGGKPDPKYALEGITRDKQYVRIIFAPSKKGMVVITCIDIEGEWSCDCR